MKKEIYLDHASTTPMHPDAARKMSEALFHVYGNASNTHKIGQKSRGFLNEARITFAHSIGATPDEIILTSGGTESDNMAIIKTAESKQSQGKHIITTNIEYQAVLQSMKYLESKGFDVTYLPVDKDGRITSHQVERAIREGTILVSIMFGNNEVGSIMPIEEIGQLLEETNILFHTDAVQAFGSKEIDVNQLGLDFLSVSSHKINGPKGIGFLYVKSGVQIPSLILGGEQELHRRAGTENIPAVIGFERAVQLMLEERAGKNTENNCLKQRFIRELDQHQIDYKVNGDIDKSLSHILSIHLPNVSSEKLLILLDLKGIHLSAGSACTAGSLEPSHVLVAMYGEDAKEVSETIRVSFGQGVNEEDIKYTVEVMDESINRLLDSKNK